MVIPPKYSRIHAVSSAIRLVLSGIPSLTLGGGHGLVDGFRQSEPPRRNPFLP